MNSFFLATLLLAAKAGEVLPKDNKGAGVAIGSVLGGGIFYLIYMLFTKKPPPG